MAAFDGLIKEILPYVPGCPDSLVLSHLRSSSIDFCEKSKAHVFDLDPISTVSGVYEYDFDQPTGTEVHQILWMTYNGNDLDPITPRSLELNYSDWRDRSSIPQVYLQKNPNTFWVVPVPNVTLSSGLLLSVALKPTRTASSVDTSFSNTYRDGILYGALHRLLRIPSKEWSDSRAANDYFSLFNEEVRQAELKGRGGDLGVPRKVHYKGVGTNPRKRYKRYGREIDY